MERRAETQGAFERGEEPSEGSARPAEARAWKRDVLEVIEARSSTRKFAQDPVTDEQRSAVLHAATRAPSAGAMMMYSILDIRNQETLDQLAVLCDDQPFIATAPWALVFVVDYAKWIDLFEHAGCFEPSFVEQTGKSPRRAPGMGEFAIAAQDAVIAAQTAVIAAEAVGLGAALEYMSRLGMENIAAHEKALMDYALTRLAEIPELKVVGTAPDKGGVIAFALGSIHPQDVAFVLDKEGVAIRTGHHCAEPIVNRMGYTSLARASFGLYTTKEDIDRFVAALNKAKSFF